MSDTGRVRRLHAEPLPKEKKTRKGRRPGLMDLALYGVMVFLSIWIVKSVYESLNLFIANNAVESKIEDLYYEKQLLLKQQEDLLTDPEIEQEAKENLGLLKPGEEVIVLENYK